MMRSFLNLSLDCLSWLGLQKMEHCIRQNSAVDIYEGYFDDFESSIVNDYQPVKTINVIRDPSEGRMITDLCFSTANPNKIAAAYSSYVFMGLDPESQKESYIWDISTRSNNPWIFELTRIISYFISDTSSRPDVVLRGPSWLNCIKYNTKDPNIAGAGKYLTFL